MRLEKQALLLFIPTIVLGTHPMLTSLRAPTEPLMVHNAVDPKPTSQPMLSVGAVDAGGKQAWFSNSGAGLTLAAPGVGIVSGYADNKVVIGSGTSQATAITSGAVAYLLGRGYHATNIIPLLSRTAAPLSAPAEAVGAGLLQLPK
jgi:subtilisin family serine protease